MSQLYILVSYWITANPLLLKFISILLDNIYLQIVVLLRLKLQETQVLL